MEASSPSPRPDHTAQGSSAGKRKPYKFWLEKPVGEGKEKMGGKVQGLRSIIGRYKIDRDVKNSVGNGEAKELICTTH